jgi:hypothetical protein
VGIGEGERDRVWGGLYMSVASIFDHRIVRSMATSSYSYVGFLGHNGPVTFLLFLTFFFFFFHFLQYGTIPI